MSGEMGIDAAVSRNYKGKPIPWSYDTDGAEFPNSQSRQREESRKALVMAGILKPHAGITAINEDLTNPTHRILTLHTDVGAFRSVAPLINGEVPLEITPI